MSQNPHRRGDQNDFYRPRQNQNNANRNRGNRGNYSRSRDWNRPPENYHNRFNNNQRSKYYNRSRFRNNHSWINQNSNYSPTNSQINDLRSALARSILQNFIRNENEVYDVQNDSSSEAHPSITDSVRSNHDSSVLGGQDILRNTLIQSFFQNGEGDVVDAGLPAIDNASSYGNSNNLESLIATTIVQNIYGNARNHENEVHNSDVEENFANTSVCKIESNVDAASQELNNASDSAEHETREIESTSQSKSGISLVPLSFLIAPKSEHTDVENEDISEKESDHSEDTVSLHSSPTVRDNFKKPEQISKKLVNQVVTMDKTNIRHVINNPVSKFDVALKMHAKKRLREEIRKQLRNMNFETAKMNEANILQPDEYIETANIPVEMLDKFKTVFGYHFSRDNDEADELNDRLVLSTNESVEHREETTQSDLRQSESKSPAKVDSQPPKIDLMTKLKNLENIKLQASLKKSKQLEDDDVYIIENPKESVTILHDDSSSDSTTTTTTTCASPMPNVNLQQKFLDSFKKVVLPNMTAKERREYEKKMENGQELANIYQMCIDKLNDKNCHITKPNLYNFSDNSSDEALNFLVQNIHDLFKQQKCDNKPSTVSKPSDKRNEVTSSKPTRSNYRSAKRKVKSYKDDERSRKVDKKSDEASNRKYRNDREKSKSKTTNLELQKSAGKSKDNKNKSDSNEKVHSSTEQSSSKDSKTKSIEYKNDKCSTPSSGRTKDCDAKDQTNNVTYIELDSPVKTSQVADSRCNINSSNERLWRSPGEKKCLQLTSEATSTTSTTPEKEQNSSNSTVQESAPKTDLAASYLELKNYIGENYINPSEVFQITSLVEQNKLSTTVLNNLKEIDSKLMDLNKKKMEIEKNIIQLQKEKMEIDLAAMQYQSDRFALISSALSNPTSYLSPNPSLQKYPNHTEGTINEFYTINNFAGKIENNCKASSRGGKRKHVPSPVKKTTNFSEKLKNRKKRCQRDILIEDAANTLFSKDDKRCEEIRMTKPSELSDKINDIFTIRTKRNQSATTSQEKEKNIAKSNTSATGIQAAEENLLPVSCVGNSVNIIDCDISDSEEEPENRPSVRSVTNGALKGFRLPIVQIIAVEGYIICASEDGNIYKFDSNTRQLISTFAKHTESITEMYVDGNSYVYSTSLDGYMKKTTVENFGLELQSINLHEPLQAINLSWNQAFIGSRWGNIFTYDTKRNKLNETLLCSVGSAITALKATKEGPRKILIISSKGEKIHFRDASSGLLLRTVSVPVNQNIYSILLNGGLLYCGSSANQVYTYDFTTGNLVNAFLCGNGAVSIKLYKNKLLFIGCYDGFIYVLEKNSGQQIGRFPGSGKMILALEIIGEKLLTSAKDNSMEIIDIPKYILALIK